MAVLAVTVPVSAAAAPAKPAPAATVTQVSFSSEDGVPITADLYIVDRTKRAPFIVLFHQAGWSRGEYVFIAPILNKLGFNCMAVDQRAGDSVNGVRNLTARAASGRGKRTTFLDALPDMRSALRYARKSHTLTKGKLLAWGSSYSAALALVVAADHPGLVDGVIAFSPGEYFTRLGKPANWVYRAAARIDKPVFMTSTRDEWPRIAPMFYAIPSKVKAMFRPEGKGRHGSQALWRLFSDTSRRDYWYAVNSFLGVFVAPPKPTR